MTVLTTARLRFEPFDDCHAEGLHAMNRDPAVQRYLLGRPETLAETRASIARVKARWAAWGYGWWALVEHGGGAMSGAMSGELVGAGCIQHLGHERANPHEIGWRLRRDRWGMGLATEAARELARHAFTTLQAPQLVAIRHPDNLASQAVMARLGMRYTGLQTWHGAEVAVHVLERVDAAASIRS